MAPVVAHGLKLGARPSFVSSNIDNRYQPQGICEPACDLLNQVQ